MNKDKIILHLCADTGSDTKLYKDAGYEVILIGRAKKPIFCIICPYWRSERIMQKAGFSMLPPEAITEYKKLYF